MTPNKPDTLKNSAITPKAPSPTVVHFTKSPTFIDDLQRVRSAGHVLTRQENPFNRSSDRFVVVIYRRDSRDESHDTSASNLYQITDLHYSSPDPIDVTRPTKPNVADRIIKVAIVIVPSLCCSLVRRMSIEVYSKKSEKRSTFFNAGQNLNVLRTTR